MSSIRELFGDPELDVEGDDVPFDSSTLTSTINDLLKDRPVPGAPPGFVSKGGPLAPQPDVLPVPPAPVPPVADAGEGGGQGGIPAPPAPLPPAPALPDPGLAPPPPLTDPFAALSDLDRQELLAVRQALADPERAVAIKRAYLGVPDPPAAVKADPPPPPPPVETLPEDVHPDSFEAKLWTQNQALQVQLNELTAATAAQTHQAQVSESMTAARNATASFAARYGDKLSREEIEAVARSAGAQKLPEAFRPVSANVEEAMGKSLEFVLRSDDALLAKVLGAPAPAPVNALPDGNGAEAQGRKRVLTALSSAASPTGDVPQRQPIQHRGDGRLTDSSKQSLIAQVLNGMNADTEGI